MSGEAAEESGPPEPVATPAMAPGADRPATEPPTPLVHAMTCPACATEFPAMHSPSACPACATPVHLARPPGWTGRAAWIACVIPNIMLASIGAALLLLMLPVLVMEPLASFGFVTFTITMAAPILMIVFWGMARPTFNPHSAAAKTGWIVGAWIAAVLSSLPLLGFVMIAVPLIALARSRSNGRKDWECGGCGYDLRGDLHRTNCTECGMDTRPIATLAPLPHAGWILLVTGWMTATIHAALTVAAANGPAIGFEAVSRVLAMFAILIGGLLTLGAVIGHREFVLQPPRRRRLLAGSGFAFALVLTTLTAATTYGVEGGWRF